MRETYENGGCTWEIINRYQLTDEYMQEHGLYSRDRITVRCIKGNDNISPGFVMDFATPSYLRRC